MLQHVTYTLPLAAERQHLSARRSDH